MESDERGYTFGFPLDNNFILKFLFYYKNKKPLSDDNLYLRIYDDKYKISTYINVPLTKYDSSF